MALPLSPPLLPQLAKPRAALPEDDGWAYERKYDGFRGIAFVDGENVEILSRSGKDLRRYFPELRFPPGRYVLDGEIVIADEGAQADQPGQEDFNALSQRIHPAVSRIERLAAETPAAFVAFDLLALDDDVLLELPFRERREALEAMVAPPVRLAPSVRTPQEAEEWLDSTEGVIAKELDAPYLPGQRKGFVKVKRVRTIDCVVVGWRPGKEAGTIGSLILGLYDGGAMRVMGHCSGFKAKEKRELVGKLAPYETGERGSADPSRWKADKDLEWVALRPELVVEVSYDHASGGRIRHGTKLLRWRDDKDPADCRFEQLDG